MRDDSAAALEEEFERDLAKDRRLLRFFNYGTLGWSLLTVALLMTLVIPMGRTSPWLILLSVYAISTRLAVFVARRALLVPRFLVRLGDDDAAARMAARAVFDRHRPALTKALMTGHPGSSGSAPELSYEDAATGARDRDIAGRRRTAQITLAVWVLVTIATIAILIDTGAGPTN